MLIYEVNLSINNDVFPDFYEWLLPHTEEVLSHKGFKRAEIGIIENQEDDNKNHLRLNFTIDSPENLQDYLTNHAPRLRTEVDNKFDNKITATRRIIVEKIAIEAKDKIT